MKRLSDKTITNIRRTRLRIRDFFRDDLWEYLIFIANIFAVAWLFNKYIEAIMFCVAHICIRNSFEKQFHFNETALCIMLTLGIIWFAIPVTMSLSMSLLSSIPIAFVICSLGFIAQDRVDLYNDNKRNEHREFIYSMDEDELRAYAKSKGLSEMIIDTLVLRVIHNYKWVEIQRERNYTRSGIRYHKDKIKEILKIEL